MNAEARINGQDSLDGAETKNKRKRLNILVVANPMAIRLQGSQDVLVKVFQDA